MTPLNTLIWAMAYIQCRKAIGETAVHWRPMRLLRMDTDQQIAPVERYIVWSI